MLKSFVTYLAPILIGRIMERRTASKNNSEAAPKVERVKGRKGVSPLVAAIGITLGAIAGVVLGFLFTPTSERVGRQQQ